MNLTKLLMIVALAGAALAAPAGAGGLDWIQLNLSPAAGLAVFDESLRLDDGMALAGRAGLTFFRYVGVEGTYGKVRTDSDDLAPNRNFPVDHLSGDLVLNLIPDGRVNPYLLGGWAELDLDNDTTDDETIELNGWEFGGGFKIKAYEVSAFRLDIRLEARDVLVKMDNPLIDAIDTESADLDESMHNFFFTAGLQISLPSAGKDSDGDGVTDRKDRCPDTPLRAMVDALGCPLDEDGDGVYDGIDICAGTPVGATVDARGCPSDADGDGVVDGIDQCAGTPPGARVDEKGCPLDSDGDGVADGVDQCPDTPKGARVNAQGCPTDSDGDGVPDGLDRCENTPSGVEVDANGCPVPTSEKEEELIDTGTLRLENVYFDINKATIKPGSKNVLDEVGAILVKWPSLRIEIGGHTDSSGSDAYNLELSQRRAQAVLDYMLGQFPALNTAQFTARGYGEAQPVASNNTSGGKAQNRRVEFKILNR